MKKILLNTVRESVISKRTKYLLPAIWCIGAVASSTVYAVDSFSGFAPVPYPSSSALTTFTTFTVFGQTAITNTGPSYIGGSLGSPTTITGFSYPAINATNGIYTGFMNVNDDVTTQGTADINAKKTTLLAMLCDVIPLPPSLGGFTVNPGVYCSSGAVTFTTGTLTLNANNDPNATFVFKINGALTVTGTTPGGGTSASPKIVLINGANQANVYWVTIGSAATLTDTQFLGNIIAEAAITLTRVNLQGRALTTAAEVTMTASTVNSS